jgi:phosphate:Na+ symporter
VGTSKNAKRAALVHLCFNVIGTVLCLVLYYVVKWVFDPVLLRTATTPFTIAIAHSCFNVFCTAVLFPMGGILEKMVCTLVPDAKKPEAVTELDARLLNTPALALERCHVLAVDMGNTAIDAMKDALQCLNHYDEETAQSIHEAEDKTDHYEDLLGTYLVKLSSRQIGENESEEAAKLLKVIGDFERISDHAVNILESAEEMQEKNLQFSEKAQHELAVFIGALTETLDQARYAFVEDDLQAAFKVEPLEEVIDNLKENLRKRHIKRLQQGECSIDVGFVWTDLLTNFERTSDHCSNIAGCVIDVKHHNMNMHETLRETRADNAEYKALYDEYKQKYAV